MKFLFKYFYNVHYGETNYAILRTDHGANSFWDNELKSLGFEK